MTKATKAPVMDTRFVIGAAETKAAIELGQNVRGQAAAMLHFLNTVVIAHGVSLDACLKGYRERLQGNGMDEAQHSFVRQCYGIAVFGEDMTAHLFAHKNDDKTVIEFGNAVSFKTKKQIEPKTAKNVMQNILGKEFTEFLKSLKDLQDGAEKGKRKPSTPTSDKEKLLANISKAISTADKKEKGDGTIPAPAADMFKTILGAVENTKLVEMESDKAHLIAMGVKNLIAAFAKLDDANAVKLAKALGDVLRQFTK
ncbi:hypothetical protein [Thiocapsa sp. N5-Cardenillas]|uniref:hypothetical protein n=1 Tax=Thiocapsa sp. N5-Cardenillas TaxID=3137397 RepID=UPI0035B41C08